jgi:hypothetical protein
MDEAKKISEMDSQPAAAVPDVSREQVRSSVKPSRTVPTTCIEHAYGSPFRLSFQVKVF